MREGEGGGGKRENGDREIEIETWKRRGGEVHIDRLKERERVEMEREGRRPHDQNPKPEEEQSMTNL